MVKVPHGRTRTGRVFDATHFADRPEDQQEMPSSSSLDTYNEDKPASSCSTIVIPDGPEGLQPGQGGKKIMLWIPASLALRTYGPRCCDRPSTRPLEFEVELS